MMERLAESASMRRFREAGGEVDYSVFRNVPDGPASVREGIRRHFTELGDRRNLGLFQVKLDLDVLDELPRRSVNETEFFGDWFDPATRSLKLLGSGTLKGCGHAVDPLYANLDKCMIVNWGSPGVEPGAAGQYAYAFARPPYSLQLGFLDAQHIFSKINEIILPKREPHRITDWTSAELTRLSNYFEAGMEWWGVFLFTIYLPQIFQLTVISASTTD